MTGDHDANRALIVTSIQSLPVHRVPEAAKSNPFNFSFDRIQNDERQSSRSKLAKLPWFLSLGLEGVTLGSLALLVLLVLPKLYNFFGQSRQDLLKSLESQTSEPSIVSSAPELLESDDAQSEPDDLNTSGDDLESSDSEEGAPLFDSDPSVVAGDSEIWRFYIKSASPEEMRPKVSELLRGLQVPEETEGLAGLRAPGGVMFKLVVTSEIVPNLKAELEKLTRSPTDHTTSDETFTWYKSRYLKRLPKGHVQLVVWISRV